MQVLRLTGVGGEDWAQILAGEQEPWGQGEELIWGEKTHHVGLRDDGGSLIALAGACVAEVQVAGHPREAVVGIGAVFVTASHRGLGLARVVVRSILAIATELGPRWAMLFCATDRVGLYEKFGFAEIGAAVWADQPSGRIQMPLHSMWLAHTPKERWPDGRVDLLGLPF